VVWVCLKKRKENQNQPKNPASSLAAPAHLSRLARLPFSSPGPTPFFLGLLPRVRPSPPFLSHRGPCFLPPFPRSARSASSAQQQRSPATSRATRSSARLPSGPVLPAALPFTTRTSPFPRRCHLDPPCQPHSRRASPRPVSLSRSQPISSTQCTPLLSSWASRPAVIP
jgi:hypothetical protein